MPLDYRSHSLNSVLVFTAFLIVFSFSSTTPVRAQSATKWTSALQNAMASQRGEIAAWVYLSDKGSRLDERLSAEVSRLSEHVVRRRLRNRGPENLVDEFDLPVVTEYLDAISERVVHIRQQSRWLNAVSVEATSAQLAELSRLPFVMKVDVVRSVRRRPLPPAISDLAPPQAQEAGHTLEYGDSFTQNQQINVPALHDMGYDGSGIIIGIMDTGFNTLEHEALAHLKILAEFDFVNNDDNVDDEAGQLGGGSHGSQTLSILAGFQEGSLIGPAYGASFLLAKTENTDSERHIEEDNWVAAAEWADGLGADVFSTSLIYRDGFKEGGDYTSADMDGQTTIITIGAEIAASRGILVVNAAGNEGPALPGENSLGAPSDGPNVLGVGAVDRNGARAFFSSVGRTADGRIKPDVMAMGVANVAIRTNLTSGFTSVQGTSFSCPLVAGVGALLLQANPSLSNQNIMDALRRSGNNSATPDSLNGWGIVDALSALQVTSVQSRPTVVREFRLFQAYPNPFNPETQIRFELEKPASISLAIYNLRGQRISTLLNGPQTPGTHSATWDGKDANGSQVSSGVYFYRLETGGRSLSKRVVLMR